MGMLLSLAAMIWSRTCLAASTRACKSSRVEAAKTVEGSTKHRQNKAIVFFILQIPFFPRPFKARVDEPGETRVTSEKRGPSQADRLKNTSAFRQWTKQRYPELASSVQQRIRIPRLGTTMAHRRELGAHKPLDVLIRKADAGAQTGAMAPEAKMQNLLRRRAEIEWGRDTVGANKKRGVPRHHGKHAAWELLSPDLRCFCKAVCGKRVTHTRVRKSCGSK